MTLLMSEKKSEEESKRRTNTNTNLSNLPIELENHNILKRIENFNVKKLNYLIQNWEMIIGKVKDCHFIGENGKPDTQQLKTICTKYLERSNGIDSIDVTYYQKNNQDRYFAQGALSL